MDTVSLTLRLPAELHEELRVEAFNERSTITGIIRESLEKRSVARAPEVDA
jgi:hypothetical protein